MAVQTQPDISYTPRHLIVVITHPNQEPLDWEWYELTGYEQEIVTKWVEDANGK